MQDDKYKIIFSKNLRYYMELNNKTQNDIIKDLNINKSAISTWCNGTRLPRMDKVDLLAKYFKINRSDLIEDPEERGNSFLADETKNSASDSKLKTPMVSIPVYASVSAGNGCFADGNIDSWVEIPESMAKHGEFFGLRVRGDSMEPDIKDGDIVIVKKQDDLPSEGKTVVAIVNGDEGFCKRLVKYAQGLGLASNNPNYLPKYYSAEEVRDLPVRILGVVQRLIRDF